jgi:hypothetical protein
MGVTAYVSTVWVLYTSPRGENCIAALSSANRTVSHRDGLLVDWLTDKTIGDLEKLLYLAIAGLFEVNSTESKREQSGIIREKFGAPDER